MRRFRMNRQSIPKATLGRLPHYLQYLKNFPVNSCNTISAAAIARGLSLGEVQVRKDLAMVSGAGKPKVGYERLELIDTLECYLGYNQLTKAVLVGAGKLGKALLDYDGFEEYGVKIVAGFDCNEQVLQPGKNAKLILPITELASYCTDNEVKLGIITVGRGSAQDVCDKMVASGIAAIWNFAPCELTVPSNVMLKQKNLGLSLAHLNLTLIKSRCDSLEKA